MRQRRVRWSIGDGCGHAIAVAAVSLAATLRARRCSVTPARR